MKLKRLKKSSNNHFGAILSNTTRSLVYLSHLFKSKTIPKFIIIYSKKNINIKIKENIIKLGCNFKIIKSNDINSNNIKNAAMKSEINTFIFSGYPGQIIKNKSFLKRFDLLHSHSGLIPRYKGSTTLYYSILNEKKIYCTTFIMNKNIDQGNILLIRKYNLPKKNMIDSYDNEIRAKNLITVINSDKKKIIKSKKDISNNSFFYKAHPILRNAANKKLI
jgi:methionyl-tRNA formyltransferase